MTTLQRSIPTIINPIAIVLLAENVKRLLHSNEVPLTERPGVPLKGKTESLMLYTPSAPPPVAVRGEEA
jgi:hypothetical protein